MSDDYEQLQSVMKAQLEAFNITPSPTNQVQNVTANASGTSTPRSTNPSGPATPILTNDVMYMLDGKIKSTPALLDSYKMASTTDIIKKTNEVIILVGKPEDLQPPSLFNVINQIIKDADTKSIAAEGKAQEAAKQVQPALERSQEAERAVTTARTQKSADASALEAAAIAAVEEHGKASAEATAASEAARVAKEALKAAEEKLAAMTSGASQLELLTGTATFTDLDKDAKSRLDTITQIVNSARQLFVGTTIPEVILQIENKVQEIRQSLTKIQSGPPLRTYFEAFYYFLQSALDKGDKTVKSATTWGGLVDEYVNNHLKKFKFGSKTELALLLDHTLSDHLIYNNVENTYNLMSLLENKFKTTLGIQSGDEVSFAEFKKVIQQLIDYMKRDPSKGKLEAFDGTKNETFEQYRNRRTRFIRDFVDTIYPQDDDRITPGTPMGQSNKGFVGSQRDKVTNLLKGIFDERITAAYETAKNPEAKRKLMETIDVVRAEKEQKEKSKKTLQYKLAGLPVPLDTPKDGWDKVVGSLNAEMAARGVPPNINFEYDSNKAKRGGADPIAIQPFQTFVDKLLSQATAKDLVNDSQALKTFLEKQKTDIVDQAVKKYVDEPTKGEIVESIVGKIDMEPYKQTIIEAINGDQPTREKIAEIIAKSLQNDITTAIDTTVKRTVGTGVSQGVMDQIRDTIIADGPFTKKVAAAIPVDIISAFAPKPNIDDIANNLKSTTGMLQSIIDKSAELYVRDNNTSITTSLTDKITDELVIRAIQTIYPGDAFAKILYQKLTDNKPTYNQLKDEIVSKITGDVTDKVIKDVVGELLQTAEFNNKENVVTAIVNEILKQNSDTMEKVRSEIQTKLTAGIAADKEAIKKAVLDELQTLNAKSSNENLAKLVKGMVAVTSNNQDMKDAAIKEIKETFNMLGGAPDAAPSSTPDVAPSPKDNAKKQLATLDQVKKEVRGVIDALDSIQSTYERSYKELFGVKEKDPSKTSTTGTEGAPPNAPGAPAQQDAQAPPQDAQAPPPAAPPAAAAAQAAATQPDPKGKNVQLSVNITTDQQKTLADWKTLQEDGQKWVKDVETTINQKKGAIENVLKLLQSIFDTEPANKKYIDYGTLVKKLFEGDYQASDPNEKKGLLTLVQSISQEIKSLYDSRARVLKPQALAVEESIKLEKDRLQAAAKMRHGGYVGGVPGVNDNGFTGTIKHITKELNDKVMNTVVKDLEGIYLRQNNPVFAAAMAEPSIFAGLYNDYLDRRNRVGSFVASQELSQQLRNNALIPREVLAISKLDKTVFVFVTLFIRLFALTIAEYMIERGVINSMPKALAAFVGFYLFLFVVFVVLVNMDVYRMRIVFNYVNFHANSGRVYSHIGMLVLFVIVIYIIMRNVNFPIKGIELKAITEEEKSNLIYRLEILTMIVWLFLVILIAVM